MCFFWCGQVLMYDKIIFTYKIFSTVHVLHGQNLTFIFIHAPILSGKWRAIHFAKVASESFRGAKKRLVLGDVSVHLKSCCSRNFFALWICEEMFVYIYCRWYPTPSPFFCNYVFLDAPHVKPCPTFRSDSDWSSVAVCRYDYWGLWRNSIDLLRLVCVVALVTFSSFDSVRRAFKMR